MSICKSCGQNLNANNQVLGQNQCVACYKEDIEKQRIEEEKHHLQDRDNKLSVSEQIAESERLEADIKAILLTTETHLNLNIVERIEIISAECAFGMHIFKDLFAGVRDIVGGRSSAVQNTLRDARYTALNELKREAHRVGANAVVGVDLDYTELSATGKMVLLVASGTAVRIDKMNDV